MNNKIIIPSEYSVPDGADINIYCKYSDILKENIDESKIKDFFKVNGKDVDAQVSDYENYKFISVSDKNSDSVIAVEFWNDFDGDDKNELIECYEEDNLTSKDKIIDILNNCNSEMLFDCRSSEEVLMVIVLATYLSKYTDYLMIFDTYNAVNLKPNEDEIIIMN